MAWGFEAINNAGSIQIDGNFSNMSMFKKGQVTIGGSSSFELPLYYTSGNWIEGDGLVRENFPARQGPPFVAVQTVSPGAPYGFASVTMFGMQGEPQYGTTERRVTDVELFFGNKPPPNDDPRKFSDSQRTYPSYYPEQICQYGFFDQIGDVLDDTDWGLQVFDEFGIVTFDSRRSYLAIVDEIDIPVPPPAQIHEDIGKGPDITPRTFSHVYQPNAWYILNGGANGQAAVAYGSLFGTKIATMHLRQESTTSVKLWWDYYWATTSSSDKSDTRVPAKLLVCKEQFID